MKLTEKDILKLKYFQWITLAINSTVPYCLISSTTQDDSLLVWLLLGLLIFAKGMSKVIRDKRRRDFSVGGMLIDGICVLILSVGYIFEIAFFTSSLPLTLIMVAVFAVEIVVCVLMIFWNKIFRT